MTDSSIPLKQCSRKERCVNPEGCWLPATNEYFHNSKKVKCGLTSMCKHCWSVTQGHTPKERLPEGMKRCPHCKEIFPHTAEFFHRSKGNKSGLMSWCNKCETIASSNYYYSHHEEQKKKSRARYAKNP